MKKTRMRIIILVMIALFLLPGSVNGQNTTNSTTVPMITGTDIEPPVKTPVPAETISTIPVNNATMGLSTNTTPLTSTVTETVSTPKETTASPPSQLSTGNISFASSPLGASILIDGVYYGTTPGNLTGISSGNHIVRLTLSGRYDYEGTTYVVPDQVTNVFGTLPPLNGADPRISHISAPATTTAPPVIVQPAQTSSGGIFENPAVIAGMIGIFTACIGAGATVFTHISKTKKE